MMEDFQLMLHGIAVKKYCDVGQVCAVTGLPAERVEALLAEALAKGRVVEAQGRYALTPAGQVSLRSGYARSCAGLRADREFMAAYEDFEQVNGELKQAITDWQTLSVGGQKVPNDHSDRAYDEAVIDRLGRIHEKVERVITRLAAAHPRLARYGDKLLAALEKAEDGDIAWVSDARTESYHTVWFELHEDLLRLAGRERRE